MTTTVETFLLVLAALFSVINPPGTALVFFSLTKYASAATRRTLARRVALNAFFVMAGSLLIGAIVLNVYGISIPVLRVAGGIIVAAAGWTLLKEGTQKASDEPDDAAPMDYAGKAFYPLTLPLTTGPGTIAVMISLGLSRSAYSDGAQNVKFISASLLAAIVMAAAIYFSYAYSDRVERLLGRTGTDIAVRLSAFILFCLGIQIIWTGASDLLLNLLSQARTAQ
jgi:multiple antibiotic resistance protein